MNETGKQYQGDNATDPTGFLEKARLHQSNYRANSLKVPFDNYGNYLLKEDALKGLNFYPDFNIFEAVKLRYKGYSKGLYANTLRSEHIPFNFFIPFNSDPEFAVRVFNKYMDGQIKSIDKIEIEYAPANKERYLSDKTSFDCYIEYSHIDGTKGIIGIEVKYTEHDYKLKPGSTEEKRVKKKDSIYYKISKGCNLYKKTAIELLPTDRFRQVWRNQLLGESILLNDGDKFKHFTSLTIFPEGNLHFAEVSKEYITLLKTNKLNFIPVTYEQFIALCKNSSPDDKFLKWIEYLEERYIVKE